MYVVEKIEELKDVIFRIKSTAKSIGLVPTMGALHEGHLSLLRQAKNENEVVVCSIFVNPLQFNDANDLKNYPRNLSADKLLVEAMVDVLFVPSSEEVFAEPPVEKYDFGNLESVMESIARSGHFNGVATIVKRLFDWVQPEKAYFGEKDFQQLRIIKELEKQQNASVQIVACPIVREKNGLAASSRNLLLDADQREIAANIYRVLHASLALKTLAASQIKTFVQESLAEYSQMKIDYFEIVNDDTLQSVESLNDSKGVVGCIAVYLGEIRLIDNIRYK